MIFKVGGCYKLIEETQSEWPLYRENNKTEKKELLNYLNENEDFLVLNIVGLENRKQIKILFKGKILFMFCPNELANNTVFKKL